MQGVEHPARAIYRLADSRARTASQCGCDSATATPPLPRRALVGQHEIKHRQREHTLMRARAGGGDGAVGGRALRRTSGG